MALPPELPAKDHNETTWDFMAMLTILATATSWLTTSDLADRAGCGRDSARRILKTAALQGWVRREPVDGSDRWMLGPELPRIGFQYQALLNRQAAILRADFETLTRPFNQPLSSSES